MFVYQIQYVSYLNKCSVFAQTLIVSVSLFQARITINFRTSQQGEFDKMKGGWGYEKENGKRPLEAVLTAVPRVDESVGVYRVMSQASMVSDESNMNINCTRILEHRSHFFGC